MSNKPRRDLPYCTWDLHSAGVIDYSKPAHERLREQLTDILGRWNGLLIADAKTIEKEK